MASERNRTLEQRVSVDGGEVISTVMVDNGVQLDITSQTVEFAMYEEDKTDSVAKVARTSTGVTKHPTKNFTYDTDLQQLKSYAHGIKDGQKVVFSTSGTLPTGLTAGEHYYARDVYNDYFSVSRREGDTKVTISSTGSGTHSFYIMGHVQYSPQAGDYDTAGTYFAAFFTSSPDERYPASPSQNNSSATTAGMIKVYVV